MPQLTEHWMCMLCTGTYTIDLCVYQADWLLITESYTDSRCVCRHIYTTFIQTSDWFGHTWLTCFARTFSFGVSVQLFMPDESDRLLISPFNPLTIVFTSFVNPFTSELWWPLPLLLALWRLTESRPLCVDSEAWGEPMAVCCSRVFRCLCLRGDPAPVVGN